MRASRSGFTLLESLLAILCFMLVALPAFQILRQGVLGSTRGVLQVQTTLEAKIILARVENDLKNACFPMTNDPGVESIADVSSLISRSGRVPQESYSFLCFPSQGTVDQVVSPSHGGKAGARRRYSRVTWRLEGQETAEKPFYRLVREERFSAGHPLFGQFPDGTRREVLSGKVGLFVIRPLFLEANGTSHGFFNVWLTLVDRVTTADLKNQRPGGQMDRASGVVIGEFCAVVYPEFFHAFWNQEGMNRNWHAEIDGP